MSPDAAGFRPDGPGVGAVGAAGEEARLFARVLELAERGRFSTSPNPRVGCVVLNARGKVAGEGFHEQAGGPHAERAALADAGDRARGGTAYVNLEPCQHHGRTPPCVDALIAAGVARVVCSVLDPDPRNAGKGVDRLRAAGIDVRVGPAAAQAERLNEPFLTSARRGRPYVHLKWAASLDGRIATRSGSSQWISSEEARRRSLELREEHDAIAVGAGTILADDARLTRRLGRSRSILPHRRVVLDGGLRVSPSAAVFSPGEPPAGCPPPEAWLVTARDADDPRLDAFRARGVRVESLPAAAPEIDLPAFLARLAALEVRSLLVEGGGETAWRFLSLGLVDRVTAFVAPLLIGGREAPGPLGGLGRDPISAALRLGPWEVEALGSDLMISAAVLRPAGPAEAGGAERVASLPIT